MLTRMDQHTIGNPLTLPTSAPAAGGRGQLLLAERDAAATPDEPGRPATTATHGELVYRLVVAVDIANYSKLDALDQSLVQTRLSEVLDRAGQRAGLARGEWYRQLRGDGELAVLPANVDAAWVVAEFTEQLVAALAAVALAHPDEPALRLRIAMHHGTLAAGHFGLAGNAPVVTCRLLDSDNARNALSEDSSAHLVLVVSEQLYQDVVVSRFHGLSPQRFRQTRVSAKDVHYAGYLCTGSPRTPQRPDNRVGALPGNVRNIREAS